MLAWYPDNNSAYFSYFSAVLVWHFNWSHSFNNNQIWLATGCDGAPLLPLLFVVVNMGFNISLLYLLKISSAVVSCLASTFSGMSCFIDLCPVQGLASLVIIA
jgi:hypothetical protein